MRFKNPPLLMFKLDIKFDQNLDLSIEKLARLEKVLNDLYPHHANLKIPEYEEGLKVVFGAGSGSFGPIEFISDDRANRVILFLNGIVFSYRKYSKWDDIREEILNVLQEINKIVSFSKIIKLRMEYIDEIKFKADDFDFDATFNLKLCLPPRWDIDYSDFHIGLKHQNEPSENPNTRWITRVRSLGIKESIITIRIENLYSGLVNLDFSNQEIFVEFLTNIHDRIKNIFEGTLGEKAVEVLGGFEDN